MRHHGLINFKDGIKGFRFGIDQGAHMGGRFDLSRRRSGGSFASLLPGEDHAMRANKPCIDPVFGFDWTGSAALVSAKI
jgi:hypothetical protein